MVDRTAEREAAARRLMAWRGQLVRYVVRRVGQWHEAEDIVAEVLLELLAEGPEAVPRQPRELYRRCDLARRAWQRRQARREQLLGRPRSLADPVVGAEGLTVEDCLPGPALPDDETDLLSPALRARLARLLADASPAERPLLACLARGLTPGETARVLACSRHALRWRVLRLREKLLVGLDEAERERLLRALRWRPKRSRER